MAVKLSKAQHAVVAIAIREALAGTTAQTLSARQLWSLRIAYEKIQEDAARVHTHATGSSRYLTPRQAEKMLEEAAEHQGVWLNTLTP